MPEATVCRRMSRCLNMGGVARRDYEVRDLVVDVSLFDESTLSYVTSAGYSVKAYFEGVYMR